jgi:hypothetical protein
VVPDLPDHVGEGLAVNARERLNSIWLKKGGCK